MSMPTVLLTTDGSFKASVQAGGYAGVLQMGDHFLATIGNDSPTTINRMELSAVIASLNQLTVPCRVHIVSDSQYVVKGINSWLTGWVANAWITSTRQPVGNQDLWEQMWNLMQVHVITAEWVKGHRGHVTNELCDQLAGWAAFSQEDYNF